MLVYSISDCIQMTTVSTSVWRDRLFHALFIGRCLQGVLLASVQFYVHGVHVHVQVHVRQLNIIAGLEGLTKK